MTGVHLRYAVYGLSMGFVLSRIGFTNYDELHAMFVFADLRMLFTFAGAVALTAVGFLVLARGQNTPARPIHNGTIVGGAIFGAGWALTGACPSIMLAQIGEGQLAAGFTLLGVLTGAWLYPRVHGRYFRWDTASCET